MSNLLSKFSIQLRLILLPVPIIVTLIIILLILVRSLNETIEFSEKEQKGIQTLKPIYITFREGLKRLKIGEEKTETLLPLLQTVNDQVINSKLLISGDVELKKLEPYIKMTTFSTENSMEFLSDIQTLALKIGDNSNLILDPEVNSYYQMDIVLFKVPEIFKNISILKGIIREEYKGESAKNQSFTNSSFTKALLAINVIELNCNEIRKSYTKSIEDPSPYESELKKAKTVAGDSCTDYINSLKSIFIVSKIKPPTPEAVFSTIHKGTSIAGVIQDQSISILENLVIDRINLLTIKRNLNISLTLIAIFISTIITFFIFKSINNPLTTVLSKIDELSSGEADLTKELPDFGNNEIGKITLSINHFLNNLNQIMNQLKASVSESEKVSAKLKQDAISVSDNATSLASISEESAASLEELTTSFEIMFEFITNETKNIVTITDEMDTIKTSIINIEKAIIELTNLSEQSTQLANSGNVSIQNTDITMTDIRSVTKEITGIVDLITEISERTNLLALNASIEAARAGEAGMGFAVVAEEISKLADKTQSSVKSIKKLIEKSHLVVNAGSNHVIEAVTSLSEIVKQSIRMNDAVNHLKQEMKTQSNSLMKVTNEITDLEDMAKTIEFSSKEQKKASEDMVNTINTLSGNAQELANNSEDLNQVSQKIGEIATNIAMITNTFRTN
ncbi:methyl-accepting chemotaxis protein [Leptospira yanagawae]|uniref:Methyl-accepting chemotaxis protein n=1 Tax=Leptospira yanagawae TaxID=293069 RepID=A0ABY2M8A5_9LEPT|nr:methyl-accepting chemotaxis protein [Leptospira yanagawae]TGL26026.1 methyl-accepting chemotaxis protein [Leptospira yanagawae]